MLIHEYTCMISVFRKPIVYQSTSGQTTFVLVFVFGHGVSLYLGPCSADQAGLRLAEIHLPLSPDHWV